MSKNNIEDFFQDGGATIPWRMKTKVDEMSPVTGNGFSEGKRVSLTFTHPQNSLICTSNYFFTFVLPVLVATRSNCRKSLLVSAPRV